MSITKQNILSPLPNATSSEVGTHLHTTGGVRIERIVSQGQSSPTGFWYDQAEAEWVMVLAGRGRLEIEGQEKELELGPGEAVFLPAHCRHRVAWTDPDQPTVWLAVFIGAGGEPEEPI